MREITLHLLDLAENSVSAGARTVQIAVCEDLQADRLTASITDDGRGMELQAKRTGLGLVGLRERVEALQGRLQLASEPGKGLEVRAWVPVPAAR